MINLFIQKKTHLNFVWNSVIDAKYQVPVTSKHLQIMDVCDFKQTVPEGLWIIECKC